MRYFFTYKIHHIVFWLVVGFIWYYLRADEYANTVTAIKVTAIKVADLAIMIYITNYILIPFFFYRKKYFLFFIFFVSLIFLSSILKMNILGRILNSPALYNWQSNWKARIYDNVLPHFFLVTAGVAVKLLIDYVRLQQRMVQIAREKAEAELNFLKSQINPHFIFNSLNAVYFLIAKENQEARGALQKFSDMLRYQLYETNGKSIPIEKELSFIRDYMELQQLRLDEKYDIQLRLDESVKGFMIEPLLLISFVENACKHVSHHQQKRNLIKVEATLKEDLFCFRVTNSKENASPGSTPGGIGLNNIKRRLELLYPGKYDLFIQNSDDMFLVNLQISLK